MAACGNFDNFWQLLTVICSQRQFLTVCGSLNFSQLMTNISLSAAGVKADCALPGGTGSLLGGTGQYLVVLGRYWVVLVSTWWYWVVIRWYWSVLEKYFVVLGHYWVVLVSAWWYWVVIGC